MFERFKRGDDDGGADRTGAGAVAASERERTTGDDAAGDGGTRSREDRFARDRDRAAGAHYGTDGDSDSEERSAAAERAEARAAARRGALTGDAMKTARARQRDEFGGLHWGASFFG